MGFSTLNGKRYDNHEMKHEEYAISQVRKRIQIEKSRYSPSNCQDIVKSHVEITKLTDKLFPGTDSIALHSQKRLKMRLMLLLMLLQSRMKKSLKCVLFNHGLNS
jgi:DNA-nicking Smr family endonuclease